MGKRTGTARTSGTAQTSGPASKPSQQGKRTRSAKPKYADDSSAPTDPAKIVETPPRNAQNAEGVNTNWPGGARRGPGDALLGHFAVIVGGLEYEEDGEKHDLTGLYGVVHDVSAVGEHGEPLEARFEIRSRATPGLFRPAVADGTIAVPWENLRRAPAGLR